MPGDNDRFTAQLYIVPLFDGSVERIHIDVYDFTHRHLAIVKLCGSTFSIGVGRTSHDAESIIFDSFRQLSISSLAMQRTRLLRESLTPYPLDYFQSHK